MVRRAIERDLLTIGRRVIDGRGDLWADFFSSGAVHGVVCVKIEVLWHQLGGLRWGGLRKRILWGRQ